MRFSIIVPMYNVQQYIDRCLDSLTDQEFEDYEVILVNDKSTDSSLELARIWEKKYPKIKIYCKDSNSGLSETRNYGINKARGQYLIFVDSDDYVEKNCLTRINTELEKNLNPDIMYFGIYEETDGHKEYCDKFAAERDRLLKANDFMLNELKHRQLYVSVWAAIYKRGLIVDNNLYFKSGLLHEDELWSPQVLYNAEKVCHVEYAFYHYYIRPNSISTAKDLTKNGLDVISTCKDLMRICADYKSDELTKWMRNHIAMLYMKATTMGKLYRKDYKKNISRIFPICNVCTAQDTIKSLLYLLSPTLYCHINRGYNVVKPK